MNASTSNCTTQDGLSSPRYCHWGMQAVQYLPCKWVSAPLGSTFSSPSTASTWWKHKQEQRLADWQVRAAWPPMSFLLSRIQVPSSQHAFTCLPDCHKPQPLTGLKTPATPGFPPLGTEELLTTFPVTLLGKLWKKQKLTSLPSKNLSIGARWEQRYPIHRKGSGSQGRADLIITKSV